MTDGRGANLVRLAEATAEAAVVLGLVVLPSALHAWTSGLAAVLGGMFVLVSAAVYGLHAVTFDCFRLTGQWTRTHMRYTHRED